MIFRIALIVFASQAIAESVNDQAWFDTDTDRSASLSMIIEKPLYESIFSRQMSSGAILDQVQETMFV